MNANLVFVFSNFTWFCIDLKGDDWNPKGSDFLFLHDFGEIFSSLTLFASLKGMVLENDGNKLFRVCVLFASVYLLVNLV